MITGMTAASKGQPDDHSNQLRFSVVPLKHTEENKEMTIGTMVLAFDTGYLMAEPIDGLPRLDHAIHAGLLLGWASYSSRAWGGPSTG